MHVGSVTSYSLIALDRS